jgi:hypothetical protein
MSIKPDDHPRKRVGLGRTVPRQNYFSASSDPSVDLNYHIDRLPEQKIGHEGLPVQVMGSELII